MRITLLLLFSLILIPVASAQLVINEIQYDPASGLNGDANGDGTSNFSEDEFIEIVNTGAATVDISGFTLSDDDGGAFAFPANTMLAAGRAAVLFGGGTPTGTFGGSLVFTDDGTIGSGLSNGGDLVELRDAGGTLITSVGYGSSGAVTGGSDQSITRSPDLSGDFADHSTADTGDASLFSPGTQIDGTAFAGGVVVTDTRVAFAASSASQAEGDAGTSAVTVTLSITNPSSSNATNVTLTRTGTADAADASLSSTMVTFPANTSADQTVTITVNGDTDVEGNEDVVLDITTVTGGDNAAAGTPSTYTLTITNDDAPAGPSNVLINEVDADTPGLDTAEFIELFGTAGLPLDAYVLVLFNGSDDQSYMAYDLDGFSLDAGGFFVLCGDDANVANCDLDVNASNLIQNGADAVALYTGSATDFPNDTPVTAVNLVDAIVYDTNDGDDTGLLGGLGQTTQYNEDENGDKDNQSIQRFADGSNNIVTANATPGAQNLPVELTSFTATANGNAAELLWETASETNNTGFEVQMDAGNGFSPVDFVQGAGSTLEAQSYNLRVADLTAGGYRFRLKQIDLDGAFEFSPVVELAIGSTEPFALSAGPNPFRRSANVSLQVAVAQDVTVEVFDLLGRSVARLFEGAMDADQSRTFSVDGSALASGLYVVRATGERFTTTRQIVRLR